MRHCGTFAESLPMSNETTLEIGRQHTSGKECLPSIITTGDFVKKALSPDFKPDEAAFFMPGASGPCRAHRLGREDRRERTRATRERAPVAAPRRGLRVPALPPRQSGPARPRPP